MEFLTGTYKTTKLELSELLEKERIGRKVCTEGAVHTIRDIGEVLFLILRKRDGLFQTVYDAGQLGKRIEKVIPGDIVRIFGVLREEKRAPHKVEMLITSLEVLSRASAPLPIAVDKWKLTATLETRLDMRAITLRNMKERAKFKIQEGIVRAFRDYLYKNGFTEIHTPKIGAKGAEGGANIFKLSYFHKPAVLQQSPQFYKQMMVGVYERVFETAPVFGAEKHNTKRHLNEYTSLDFEMGYIENFEEIMQMETGFLQYMIKTLKSDYKKELELLDISLPETDRIPKVRFEEAKRLVAEKYQRPMKNPYDLEPEEESLIGTYFQEEFGADFVFVTHYPSKKRPFYTMDEPLNQEYTLSFDLLFRGVEVTTGGQRIHDYKMLLNKIERRGMSTEGMEPYLDAFRYGMPPHGGLGIGLERLTMQFLGEENVREACLFPRDINRLIP